MTTPSRQIDITKAAEKHGIPVDEVQRQLTTFENGVPYIRLDRPATIGDGILRLAEDEATHYESYHRQAADEGRLMRFVPASGAASRMFKQLQAVAADQQLSTRTQIEHAAAEGNTDAAFTTRFFDGLTRFAFYHALCQTAKQHGVDIEQAYRDGNWQRVLEFVLGPEGLHYAGAPKGLILFHADSRGNTRTAFQEQLAETAAYATDSNGTARVHFTVSSRFRETIDNHLGQEAAAIEKHGIRLSISLSEQQPHNDTIAVNLDNTPFVDDNGAVLFRPGGHGALLENLQDLEADIVFIKNIDNVLPVSRLDTIVPCKKRLCGVLLETQQKIFHALERLDESDLTTQETEQFAALANDLGSTLPDNWPNLSQNERTTWLTDRFNRPLRVCGMVKNEGEPGGGPFWVRHADGSTSLQIVESTQVDHDDTQQQRISESATHFNPVDIVCGLRDRHGKNYKLTDFVDPDTALIAKKSKNGRTLKALERPGLWNGSMARWNTVFVEVPAETFNPVKTVNDLLRPAHQIS